MESSIQDKSRTIQTDSYVLRNMQFPGDLSGNDGRKKEIEGDLIVVYMDDVLGFSKTIKGLKKIE